MADANLHPMSMEYAEEHPSFYDDDCSIDRHMGAYEMEIEHDTTFYDSDCSIDRHIAEYEINVEESNPATGQLHTHFKFL